jgi:shikimate 5-dehydrogenase
MSFNTPHPQYAATNDAVGELQWAVSQLHSAGIEVILDVVYNPWPTQLAASWAVTGGTIVSGLAMLLHQAGHQVTLMTGKPAPVAQMREALNAELLARGLSTI